MPPAAVCGSGTVRTLYVAPAPYALAARRRVRLARYFIKLLPDVPRHCNCVGQKLSVPVVVYANVDLITALQISRNIRPALIEHLGSRVVVDRVIIVLRVPQPVGVRRGQVDTLRLCVDVVDRSLDVRGLVAGIVPGRIGAGVTAASQDRDGVGEISAVPVVIDAGVDGIAA